MNHSNTPAAFTIKAFCNHYGISRSKVYLEAAQGRLPIRKVGKRALILREDADTWLAALPMSAAFRRTSELGAGK